MLAELKPQFVSSTRYMKIMCHQSQFGNFNINKSKYNCQNHLITPETERTKEALLSGKDTARAPPSGAITSP